MSDPTGPEGGESRATQRRRMLKGGTIVLNEGNSTIDCTVRNLSETGARLKVASIIGIPDNFRLIISGEQSFSCAVVWKREAELGVRFS